MVCHHNLRDVHHQAVEAVMRRLLERARGRGLLLEYVFLEVVTVLLAKRGLAVASAVAGSLLQAQELEFVPCSDFFVETVETFRTQKRGTLSFTDAAVVAVARRRSDGLVATFDTDFRGIEGIRVVSG